MNVRLRPPFALAYYSQLRITSEVPTCLCILHHLTTKLTTPCSYQWYRTEHTRFKLRLLPLCFDLAVSIVIASYISNCQIDAVMLPYCVQCAPPYCVFPTPLSVIVDVNDFGYGDNVLPLTIWQMMQMAPFDTSSACAYESPGSSSLSSA